MAAMGDTVSWSGYEALQRRLGSAARITFAMATPLLESFEKILVEGNRKKVLSGQDGLGNPMIPVTYRRGAAIKSVTRTKQFGRTKYAAKGLGFKKVKSGDPHANGNLTSAEYRKLTGPPLAPRGERSRVITNLETSIGQANGGFFAAKAWREVVDRNGRPFLMAHFKGARTGRGLRVKLPKRDLRGLSVWELEESARAVRRWAAQILSGKLTT